MKDRLRKNFASGRISIYRGVNKEKLIFTRNNSLIATHKDLMVRMMAGDLSALISRIEAYDGVSLKAGIPVTRSYETSPDIIAQFEGIFGTNSFSGEIDKLKLSPADPDTNGYFAEATVEVEKDSSEQLTVVWTIEIGD